MTSLENVPFGTTYKCGFVMSELKYPGNLDFQTQAFGRG